MSGLNEYVRPSKTSDGVFLCKTVYMLIDVAILAVKISNDMTFYEQFDSDIKQRFGRFHA